MFLEKQILKNAAFIQGRYFLYEKEHNREGVTHALTNNVPSPMHAYSVMKWLQAIFV